ncbi:MAG: rhomboid family intramembrane serine protease, partial [Flavobacteriales bacterium]
NLPEVVKNLLIINILMFLGIQLFPDYREMLALHNIGSDYFMPHQLITHIFMHGSFAHLLFNMFALAMFGSTLEKVWGGKKFLIVYFVSAAGALVLQLLFNYYNYSSAMAGYSAVEIEQILTIAAEGRYFPDTQGHLISAVNTVIYNDVGMVGASGAIMGLLAAFAYLFPNTELMLIFLPIPVKAKYFIPFYMLVELFLGVNRFEWDNIAHFAHLGGAIAGFILVLIWNKKRDSFY